MASVYFTSHLESFVTCEPANVDGATVGEALRAALTGQERLATYLFDERGRLRRHIMVFVDGQIIEDRVGLSDSVGPETEIYVMQALSGG